MSLVCNANGLVLVAHGHTRSGLLGADGTGLGFILDERNTLAAGHQSDFLEALEPAKDLGQTLLAGIVGEIPQEQNLVGG